MLRPTLLFTGIAAVFFVAFALVSGERADLWLWWLGVASALLALMFGLFGLMERIAPMEPDSRNPSRTPHEAMRSKQLAGGAAGSATSRNSRRAA